MIALQKGFNSSAKSKFSIRFLAGRTLLSSAAMNEQECMKILAEEGFTQMWVAPIPANADFALHTHHLHTIQWILEGQITITDETGIHTFHAGQRAEFPKGTVHAGRGGPQAGRMVVAMKS